ncbi:MAG: HAMP domain-containing sensor histidine kinase [Aerococcus sp.]|nr:HAMP domain-containing sensor histidine kinase [Aerococcus sp.]
MPQGKKRWRIFIELAFETIAILAILLIGYFGLLFVFLSVSEHLFPYIVLNYPYYALMYPRFQQYFALGFTLLYGILSLGVLIWRVTHRLRTIQLGYILDELHYISQGHYDYRISDKHLSSMQPIVESINRLVDSTVQAMNEERRIEKSKDELIANMSHDIRTPLTSIIGYIGLIQSGRVSSREEAQKYADVAYNKAIQMQRMVEDLFEYTKVSQVGLTLNLEEVNVLRLLEQLEVEYDIELQEANRTLEIHSNQDPVLVEIDSEKIVRVFSNLITNALKYAGDEGHYIHIDVTQSKQETKFCVANDGAKIPQEQLGLLFQRFYRADPSRTTKGSGLGLAIAESIVRIHHGKIWAESDEESTRFIFVIPNQQEKEQVND